MRNLRAVLVLAMCVCGASLAPAVAAGADVSRPPIAPPQGAHAREVQARGSLSVAPTAYVGGQAVTFSGGLGVPGKRRISMQLHMNRPGDKWFEVRGFTGTTTADGSFRFEFPAPSMFGIRYRVVSGTLATPPVSFNAKGQDLAMWVATTDPRRAGEPGQAVAGEPFTLVVDTTPSLFRRPETIGLPVFAGRGLTLQRRVDGDTWESLARSSVGADGMGYFPGIVAPAGSVVYRAVADDIATGANRIGWIQTFPTYVTVLERSALSASGERSTSASSRTVSGTSSVRPSAPRSPRRGAGAAGATASSKYGWYPALWDYSWEAGQSLTSPADTGSARSGWWQDYADGAGRVSRQNGGLYLDSQRNNGGGAGDFGTTRATLVDSAQAYGRWEARLRLKSAETGSADFQVLVELVPARPEDYACGRRNITLAEVGAHSNTVTYGVRADTARWSSTRRIPSLIHSSPAVAVEVAKGHITWFWDGKPIGTVRSKEAVSDVPLTLRLSMVGDLATEHNQTAVISDWQRGFPLTGGKQVTNGAGLSRTALTTCES